MPSLDEWQLVLKRNSNRKPSECQRVAEARHVQSRPHLWVASVFQSGFDKIQISREGSDLSHLVPGTNIPCSEEARPQSMRTQEPPNREESLSYGKQDLV